jgi:hypothetical protein
MQVRFFACGAHHASAVAADVGEVGEVGGGGGGVPRGGDHRAVAVGGGRDALGDTCGRTTDREMYENCMFLSYRTTL